MKKHILSLFTAAFVIIITCANSNGIADSFNAQNRTGAGGSSNNCAGSSCHAANSNDLILSILLIKLDGDTVKDNKYVSNEIYTCTLYGHIFGNYPEFGFQFTSEKDNGIGGGYFIPSNPQVHTNVIAPYEIVEQNQPIPAAGNDKIVSFLFKAPAAGAGDLRLYATMLAADGNGFSNGDKANNTMRAFASTPLSAANINEDIKMAVFPNPVKNELHFTMSQAEKGNYKFTVVNMHGQFIEKKNFTINTADFATTINTSSWPAGNYLLHIDKDGAGRNIPIIKL